MQLEGTRIIVTGGAQGIGAALVEAYAAEGATVRSLDVKDELGRETAEKASAAGGAASYEHCDVAEREQVDAAFNKFAADAGGLDVLVHAAGIELASKAEEITDEDWRHQLAVNLDGTFFTNRAAFWLLRDHGGRILDFASGAGVRGFPGHAHYSVSKGAVLSWVRTVAVEWGRYTITVNAICPGMWTPMYDNNRARYSPDELVAHDAAIAASTPIDGKLGDPPRDLAPFMVFMAGPGSRYMTGQTLVVDGGRTMVR